MKPGRTRPMSTTRASPAISDSQMRSATKPTCFRPATSWADPGMTSVITIRVTARRNLTRARRSAPEGAAGGMEGDLSAQLTGAVLTTSVSPVTAVTSRTARRKSCYGGTVPSPPMAERRRGSGDPREGTPEYNWLYGGGDPGQGGAPADPDHTRVLPTSPRPGTSRSTGRGPAPAGPGQRPPSARRAGGSGLPPSGPRPTSSRRRSRLGWVKLVLLLWLVFLVAVPLWAWSKIDKVDAEPDGDRPGSQPGHTYLLVGSDSREGLSKADRQRLGTGVAEGQRTDTIMLLHTGSGPNLLLSIPRDSIVDVPGHGENKVNAAYAWGGPELLVQTLEEETGVAIDSYVEVGFGGFVNVVDAV